MRQPLIKYRKTSIKRTKARKKKSRSQLCRYSGRYLKTQKLAKNAASPKANSTLSATGYLNSPFQVCSTGQTISITMTQCRQIVDWKQLNSPSKVPVAIRRRQPKNYSHFLQIGVYYVQMHLYPTSWRIGNKRQKPAIAAASISFLESTLLWLIAWSAADARKNAEQQVQGRQTHLKKPLRNKYIGSISRLFLPAQRCSPMKMTVIKIKPTSTQPKES